jgi:hypothetical protein
VEHDFHDIRLRVHGLDRIVVRVVCVCVATLLPSSLPHLPVSPSPRLCWCARVRVRVRGWEVDWAADRHNIPFQADHTDISLVRVCALRRYNQHARLKLREKEQVLVMAQSMGQNVMLCAVAVAVPVSCCYALVPLKPGGCLASVARAGKAPASDDAWAVVVRRSKPSSGSFGFPSSFQ